MMYLSEVTEVEELLEFTQRADSAGISTHAIFFSVVQYVLVKTIFNKN